MWKRYTDQPCWGTPVHEWSPFDPNLPYEGVQRLEPYKQYGRTAEEAERYIQSRYDQECSGPGSSSLADDVRDKCSIDTVDDSGTSSAYNSMPKVLNANEDVYGDNFLEYREDKYSVQTHKPTAEDVDPYLRRENLTESCDTQGLAKYRSSDPADDFRDFDYGDNFLEYREDKYSVQTHKLTAEDVDPYLRRESLTQSCDTQGLAKYSSSDPADDFRDFDSTKSTNGSETFSEPEVEQEEGTLELHVDEVSPHHEDAPPSTSKASKPKVIIHRLSDRQRFARLAANFMYVDREEYMEQGNKLGITSPQSEKSTAKVDIQVSTADSVDHYPRDNPLLGAWLFRPQHINHRTSDLASNLGNRDPVNSKETLPENKYKMEEAVKRFALDDVDPYLRDA